MLIRIRNLDGNFSKGGHTPHFTKKGKTWSSLGYVKSHLRQSSIDKLKHIYLGCTIVCIDDDNDYLETLIPMSEFLETFSIAENERTQVQKLHSLKAKRQLNDAKIYTLIEENKRLDKEIANFNVI